MAYVEMFGRDRQRFRDARERLNESPLGAAALAGTPFPHRPPHDGQGARLRPADPQLARCVSDRDFALEFLAAASICAVHLSRFAEEIVIWSTPQFGFIRCRTSLLHRLVDHAAEEATPTPPNWCAPRRAASTAR
jgi:argininosuccinate lyase